MLTIKTSMGDMKVELFEKEAPVTTANFLKYVSKGHYTNTIFHRVIKDFMVQGGGYDSDFNEKDTLPPIKNEAANGLKNKRGTLSMARTSDVHSATAQFFINTVDNGFLDYQNPSPRGFGYCVFGEVVEGLDVLDKIRAVETGSHGPHDDVPQEPVEIHEISVIED
ncbi:MAG: peptidylprolyl isomerase [Lentisphaerae bacterium GWF2_52_8]|nr:MAG: peptidylprolyl isomerase [Lentisphaerae bacterium GWF2_52_8]